MVGRSSETNEPPRGQHRMRLLLAVEHHACRHSTSSTRSASLAAIFHRFSANRVDVRYRLWTRDNNWHVEITGFGSFSIAEVARRLRFKPPDRIHRVASRDAHLLPIRTSLDCSREAYPHAERSTKTALHKVRLTTRAVADARPRDRRYIVWDDELTGFGVRISPSGLRSFIVQYRVREGGRGAANRRQVLGHFPDLTPPPGPFEGAGGAAHRRAMARAPRRRFAVHPHASPRLRGVPPEPSRHRGEDPVAVSEMLRTPCAAVARPAPR